MCSLGSCPIPEVYCQIRRWIEEGSLPPLGASPDGLIRHSDGSLEVLEVKCSSPFVAAGAGVRTGAEAEARAGSLMTVSDRGPPETVGAWHVPQLQMEMLCAGPACRSAVVVLLTISSAMIFRVPRDDEVRSNYRFFCISILCLFLILLFYVLHYVQYILQMLAILREFYVAYICSVKRNKLKPPPPNFFPPNGKSSCGFVTRYGDFYRRTSIIARSATLIGRLEDFQIQRSSINDSFFVDT